VKQQYKIVCIDDCHISKAFYEVVLGRTHEVKILNSCDKAITYLRAETPDIILLDVDIEFRRGVEFLKELSTWVEAPIIVHSSIDKEEVTKQGDSLRKGAVDFISKPPRLNLIELIFNSYVNLSARLRESGSSIVKLNTLRTLSYSGDTPVVVLIEDNVTYANQIAEILGETHDLRWYRTVGEARDYLFSDQTCPDLILLDRMFDNGESGQEFLKEIRDERRLLYTPVIMLTNSFQSSIIEECFRCGANEYIIKNIDARNIIERVKIQVLIKKLLGTGNFDRFN